MFPIAASIPYLFYFFFLLILTGYKKIKSRNQILFLLLLIAIVVFISYNGEYSDWRAYKAYTDNCRCIECTYFEPLFDLLTYVASQTIGFKLIPLVSFIMLFIVFIKINKFANNNLQYFILTLSIFLIFLPLYYGALRQSISFSFVLLSLLYFYDAKYFKSIF
jgi:magnesium-transporting ATPase (P-type)